MDPTAATILRLFYLFLLLHSARRKKGDGGGRTRLDRDPKRYDIIDGWPSAKLGHSHARARATDVAAR